MFDGMTPHPDTVWWVVDGDPRNGWAGARIDQGELVLERVWVSPRLRGRGLQLQLIRKRLRWGRRQGCLRARTYTWGGNLASMNSLIRAGFRMCGRTWDGAHSWVSWEKWLTGTPKPDRVIK